MARIPESFINELMNRVDIVDVIDARVPLKKTGREFQACCPFHTEKTPSFTVSPQKQFYHCFGCGAHGTVIGFLMEYERLEFPDAVRQLAETAGMEVPVEAGAADRVDQGLYDVMDAASNYFRKALKGNDRAVEYLKGRGVTGEIAAQFGLGYAPDAWEGLMNHLREHGFRKEAAIASGLGIPGKQGQPYDRFRDRVMFPIRDRRGRVIAFGGRVLGAGEPKYLNSPETPLFHKGRELYGLWEAKQALRELPRLLVVEGYMDVVALAQHGIQYSVATLGTATTPEHLDRLFRATREVVFCFDGDKAGRRAAEKAAEIVLSTMREGRSVQYLFLPEGEDPDSLVRSLGKDGFEEFLTSKSMDAGNYLISRAFENLRDRRDPAQRATVAKEVRRYLDAIPDRFIRNALLNRASVLLGLGSVETQEFLESGKWQQSARTQKNYQPLLTPMRRAIVLLMHQPALAGEAAPHLDALRELDLPGADLLVQLVEFLHPRPEISMAALLENWRDTPAGTALHKLAGTRLEIPEDGMAAEFRHVLDYQLLGSLREKRADASLATAGTRKPSEMTEAERRAFWEAITAGKPVQPDKKH